MNEIYYREQLHICGETKETAAYAEVDLYPVSLQKHRASIRAKKKEASTLAQMKYNEKMAKRKLVQLINTNFREKDFVLTLTFDNDHLPDPGDEERVDREWTNFMKRVCRYCDKAGVERPKKWIAIAEYTTINEDGTIVGRHHIHAILENVSGLTRDAIEKLWSDRNGNRIGTTHTERLQQDHGSAEALARYITKNKRCKRRWRQSRGLAQPITPRPNDTKWNAKKLGEASTLLIDDREFWTKQFPGWTFDRVVVMNEDVPPSQRHLIVILWRPELVPKWRMRN